MKTVSAKFHVPWVLMNGVICTLSIHVHTVWPAVRCHTQMQANFELPFGKNCLLTQGQCQLTCSTNLNSVWWLELMAVFSLHLSGLKYIIQETASVHTVHIINSFSTYSIYNKQLQYTQYI
jgi:hypothetical protein